MVNSITCDSFRFKEAVNDNLQKEPRFGDVFSAQQKAKFLYFAK